MLNNKDLEFINCEPSTVNTLLRLKQSELLETIQLWLNVPELNSNDSTIEDYMHLNRNQILDRMRMIDWPNGYRACQIAHLKLKMFQQSKRKLWRSIQLSNEKRIVRLNMDMEEIRTRMEAYLSNLFHCYVYAENQGSTDTFLFSLAITEKSKDPLVFSDLRFGFMVYFPETNLVISPYYVWLSSYDKYFKEALLETFGAASFIFKAMHVQSIKDVKDLAIYKESKSIFKDIGNKQLDANPLDIRQKRQHVFDDDDDDDDNNNDSVKQKRKKTSNESTEQKKRIVPIDIDELEDRIDNLKNSIGWRPMSGHRSLQINLNVPFQPNTELQEHNYADDVVNITIDMEGFNVAEGIRDMIRHGLIELPAPVWLEGVGISGTKNVTVTSDGVFTEEDEEDDRNEPAYRKNPMF